MTLSKYCRMNGINLIGISKRSKLPITDINKIYNKSVLDFEYFANKWSEK